MDGDGDGCSAERGGAALMNRLRKEIDARSRRTAAASMQKVHIKLIIVHCLLLATLMICDCLIHSVVNRCTLPLLTLIVAM